MKTLFDKGFIPQLPFSSYKWKWASLQCTEGLNDPVVLLGVLFRMRKLEPLKVKYSSDEFAQELISLSEDISTAGIGVDLARRTGERNLIRNSGQYWRGLSLIPPKEHSGIIQLTEFGRKVADREISQSEFAAIIIKTFHLPNPNIQSKEEVLLWKAHKIEIYPLRLILSILLRLLDKGVYSITLEELIRIVIPLSAYTQDAKVICRYIEWFRTGEISISEWPNCCPEANDMRIAREYFLFLENYGYIFEEGNHTRLYSEYHINQELISEITEIVNFPLSKTASLMDTLGILRGLEVTSEIERKRIRSANTRPHQAQFRKSVLQACERCVITNATMPEILEAAHIKPYKYKGEDTIANGLAMRVDIHTLFDAGHLRISPEGKVDLTQRARLDYGSTIPPMIYLPDFIDRSNLKWRWDNYDGL